MAYEDFKDIVLWLCANPSQSLEKAFNSLMKKNQCTPVNTERGFLTEIIACSHHWSIPRLQSRKNHTSVLKPSPPYSTTRSNMGLDIFQYIKFNKKIAGHDNKKMKKITHKQK